MALYRYFKASEKSSCKLPDPRGPLSRLIPSSSIVSARESAESVGQQGEHSEKGGKGQRYSKLTPELKAKYQQAGSTEHVVAEVTQLLGDGCGYLKSRRSKYSVAIFKN